MTHEPGPVPGPDQPPPPPPAYGVGPSGEPAWGQPAPGHPPAYTGHPYAGHPAYAGPMRDPDARPGTVTAAAVVTFALAGLVLLLLLVMVVALVVARDGFLEGFQDSSGLPGDPDAWFAGLLAVLLGFVLWTVAAIVLGVLVLKRRNWARIALVVSSALTIVVSLVAISGGASVLTLAGGIAVITLLFTGGAGDWFHREHLFSPPRLPKL